eukprot:jgi/Chrzof1/5292/Cz15g21030.t1
MHCSSSVHRCDTALKCDQPLKCHTHASKLWRSQRRCHVLYGTSQAARATAEGTEPSTSGRDTDTVTKHEVVRVSRHSLRYIPDSSPLSKLQLDDASILSSSAPPSSKEAQTRAETADDSLQIHMVQWYPGHIAKAERQLKEQLKMVDVVLEVRDARIPLSTCHPQVPTWVGQKPRLIIMNRQDMISRRDKQAWDAYYKEQGQQVFWTDGKLGSGTQSVLRAAVKVGSNINEKRAARGLKPRSVRACVIGFPNIGKSALINRLLGRKVVESAARPGVTRVLRWVRLGEGDIDLLDAPGVIPASFSDQIAAQRLAMCNDIGEASYVHSLIAAALIIRIKQLPGNRSIVNKVRERYRLNPMTRSAEQFVADVAGALFAGDKEKAGVRILQDYRNCALGEFALETPEDVKEQP